MTLLLLVAVLCTGVAIVVAAISVVTAPGFLQLLTTPYNQVLDHAFDLDHADCKILIYGDSSSMTSDDPATIEAQTHLKTCSISQTQPIVSITGTLPIDLYLKNTGHQSILSSRWLPTSSISLTVWIRSPRSTR
jgi:hypothetical protein